MINKGRTLMVALVGLGMGVSGCHLGSGAQENPNSAFQGTVELSETSLGFELGGRLTELLAKEGDRVEAGTVLARIDDGLERTSRDAQASQVEVARQQASAVKAGVRGEELRSQRARVDAAKATEQLLQKQVARERELVQKGAVAVASLDDLEARLARASAERDALEHDVNLLRQGARREDISVAEARAQAASAALEMNDARLSRHELRTPVAGTVLDVNFEPGEVVGAGAPVFTLADTRSPYVDVFVPQGSLGQVAVGRAALVKVDGGASEFRGRVEHLARRTEFTPRYLFSEKERATLVVRVRVRIEDPEQRLRAGVPAFVRLVEGK